MNYSTPNSAQTCRYCGSSTSAVWLTIGGNSFCCEPCANAFYNNPNRVTDFYDVSGSLRLKSLKDWKIMQ